MATTLCPRPTDHSKLLVVGLAEMAITNNPDKLLITHSLGSCLGLAIWDPSIHLGGMLHAMLPRMRKEDQHNCPIDKFVDTGLINLLNAMGRAGARLRRCQIYAAGCGHNVNTIKSMRIGDRNLAIMRQVMWKNNLLLRGEETGGNKPRTIRLQVSSGDFFVNDDRLNY